MGIPSETCRCSPIPAVSTPRFLGSTRIADLTLSPRAGAKGAGLHAFLETAGYAAGPAVNKAYRQTDGSLIALLSPTEILWLGASASDRAITRWSCPDGQPLAPQTYPVPRSDGTYWFQLAGKGAEVGLSRLCSVDFSSKNCPDLSVAQTQVAGVNTIVIHDRDADECRFHLIGDISLATYMWEALTSAATGTEG